MYHRLDVYQVLGGERPGLVVVNPVALSGPVLRRRFQQQFGFDPFEGLEVAPELVHDPTSRGAAFDEFVSDLGRSLHAGSGLPVALFDWRRGTPVLLAPPARP